VQPYTRLHPAAIVNRFASSDTASVINKRRIIMKKKLSVNASWGSGNQVNIEAAAVEPPARTRASAPDGRSHGEDAQGTPLCITVPSNSIPDNFTPLLFGVDSLYLSFPGDLSEEWEKKLEHLKLLAQSESEKEQAQAQLKIGEHLFEVSDHGAKRFPYILADNCFYIKLSGSRAKSLPLAHVQISSEYLHAVGEGAATANLCGIIAQFGSNAVPIISRADVFLDFICAVDFDGLNQECWMTRANLLAKYYDRRIPQPFTGWVVGAGGDLSSRLYEKTVEIEYKSRKFFFHELWQKRGWKLGDKVWRQEFQLRREVLKQLGTHTVPDLLQSFDALWRYLTQDWLRLAIPNATDATRTRWPTHPVWQSVSQVFDQFTEDQPRLARFRPQRLPREEWMLVNGLGGLTSFMASKGIEDFDEGWSEYLHRAKVFHHVHGRNLEDYILRKVKTKARRYNTLDNTTGGQDGDA
jgi:hypothetical protein